MPSSRQRSRTPAPETQKSGERPEIMRQLGRAVLSYSLKRLSQQQQQESKQSSRPPHDRSSRSRNRSSSRPASKPRSSSRDLARGDSDMHNLVSQLAVGAFAFGIRHLIRRRREANKRKAEEKQAQAQADAAAAAAAAAARSSTAVGGQHNKQGAFVMDTELSAALDTVAKELQGASDSIRRLAYSASPPSHRNCVVRDALVEDADRLRGSLANMQASINNMRNLHPGLEEGREKLRLPGSGSGRTGRRRRKERREGSRERDEEGRRRRRRRERSLEREGGVERMAEGEVREHRRRRRRREGEGVRERPRSRERVIEEGKGERDRNWREGEGAQERERPRSRLSRRDPDWDEELRIRTRPSRW